MALSTPVNRSWTVEKCNLMIGRMKQVMGLRGLDIDLAASIERNYSKLGAQVADKTDLAEVISVSVYKVDYTVCAGLRPVDIADISFMLIY